MGKQNQPFVSICTPTFNRRPFIPAMIECFNHQTYPKNKMEWIIIDDGTDKIEDLVNSIPNVKYFKYDSKMPLGKKRNLMHSKTKGEIIIYMDDDDYYPPERVSHAVTMLLTHPKALCAGASEIYIYFKHIQKMYQFGPYGPKHATAGTFAFKRELLKDHKYDDNASLAEERAFLKDYTVPFVQLEPKKTILVFSHTHNTFDKKTLLNNINPKYTKESDKKVEDFIKEKNLFNFFVNEIEDALINYKQGEPSMKPDVLDQIKTLTASRNEIAKQGQLCHEVNGKQEILKPEEIATILTQQDATIKILQETLKKKDSYIKLLESKLSNTDEWTILPTL
jgi:glycosyltransferase involved in cell wall biosynthesis